MRNSAQWVAHFKQNLKKQRVNWSLQPNISNQEKTKILYGLKAWQRGETSEGSHLKKAASRYAQKTGDPHYYQSICLFIREEQKHGNNLGVYLDRLGEKRLTFDWGDFLFRKIRGLNRSMEIWTITVIIVELAAQVFYKALKNATDCSLLRQICTDILIDEAYHIQFQNERLGQILSGKDFLLRQLSIMVYYGFGLLVTCIIWMAHRRAFTAGKTNWRSYFKHMTRGIERALEIEYSEKRSVLSVP